MSQARPLPSLPPTVFDRAVDQIVISFKHWRFNRATAALEHDLARIVETASGHQAKGLPTGSPAYVELYRQANLRIDGFGAKHSVPRLTIEQEVPVLRDLEALTHAPSPVAGLRRGLGMLIAGIIGAILIGCASGLVTIGYRWVVRLLVG